MTGEDCTFLVMSKTRPSEADRVKALEAQVAKLEAKLKTGHAHTYLPQRENDYENWVDQTDGSVAHHTSEMPFVEEHQSPATSESSQRSDSEEDPLRETAVHAPLRSLGHVIGSGQAPATHDTDGSTVQTPTKTKKRKRHSDGSEEKVARLRQLLPFERGQQHHLDPIDAGLCTSSFAQDLFALFFDECHIYMPVFDLPFDGFDRLRRRSPFCFASILTVAILFRESIGNKTLVQKSLQDHVETIAKETLFTDVAGLEVVQAFILLGSWGNMGWRLGNHALTLAYEMGLSKCLTYLFLSGMGQGRTESALEADRPWVTGARLWLILYKMKVEMALNNGAPVSLEEGDTLLHARAFLTHPLTTELDSRVVAACELLRIRLALHEPTGSKQYTEAELTKVIMETSYRIETWEAYWSTFYDLRAGPDAAACKALMTVQIDFSILHVNARALHRLYSARDVAKLSDDRLLSLHKALRAAHHLVSDTAGSSPKNKLRYANNYTHIAIAYAARCLIRLASLAPHRVDLRQVGKGVEALANSMASFPGLAGLAVSNQLQRIVSKARQSRALPPLSALTSPLLRPQTLLSGQGAELDDYADASDSVGDLAENADTHFNSIFEWAEGWDFTFAEELFSAVTAQAPTNAHGPAPFWENDQGGDRSAWDWI